MGNIITGNVWFAEIGAPTWERYLLAVIIPGCRRHGVDLLPPHDSLPVCAIVNRGRWLISCICGGFEYAWEEGFYFCASCLNESLGHRIGRSYFPKDRLELEAALLPRPLSARNWNVHEALPKIGAVQSVADLQAENLQHLAQITGGR